MEEFDIPTRQEISVERDNATLSEWLEEVEDICDSCHAQIAARNITGTTEPDWLNRVSKKLALADTARRRITRQLKALAQ